MSKILKYLFEVEYEDGEIYKQTPADKSKIDPEKRSEFYDVMQEVEKGRKIVKFSLVGEGNKVSVDLVTGMFIVNGLEVLLEGDKVPGMPKEFQLIFYRQTDEDLNITVEIQGDGKTPKIIKQEKGDTFTEYFIGWQCNINGKNYQQKLAVA
jgi:hypothetical protein